VCACVCVCVCVCDLCEMHGVVLSHFAEEIIYSFHRNESHILGSYF
jgi:hypothetical protein